MLGVAEGQGFEPWRNITAPSGFQDRGLQALHQQRLTGRSHLVTQVSHLRYLRVGGLALCVSPVGSSPQDMARQPVRFWTAHPRSMCSTGSAQAPATNRTHVPAVLSTPVGLDALHRAAPGVTVST